MRKQYDFKKAKKNPYAKHFKQQITIRLDKDVINYFKSLSEETGISYQNLINLYLRQCADHNKKPEVNWKKTGSED